MPLPRIKHLQVSMSTRMTNDFEKPGAYQVSVVLDPDSTTSKQVRAVFCDDTLVVFPEIPVTEYQRKHEMFPVLATFPRTYSPAKDAIHLIGVPYSAKLEMVTGWVGRLAQAPVIHPPKPEESDQAWEDASGTIYHFDQGPDPIEKMMKAVEAMVTEMAKITATPLLVEVVNKPTVEVDFRVDKNTPPDGPAPIVYTGGVESGSGSGTPERPKRAIAMDIRVGPGNGDGPSRPPVSEKTTPRADAPYLSVGEGPTTYSVRPSRTAKVHIESPETVTDIYTDLGTKAGARKRVHIDMPLDEFRTMIETAVYGACGVHPSRKVQANSAQIAYEGWARIVGALRNRPHFSGEEK